MEPPTLSGSRSPTGSGSAWSAQENTGKLRRTLGFLLMPLPSSVFTFKKLSFFAKTPEFWIVLKKTTHKVVSETLGNHTVFSKGNNR